MITFKRRVDQSWSTLQQWNQNKDKKNSKTEWDKTNNIKKKQKTRQAVFKMAQIRISAFCRWSVIPYSEVNLKPEIWFYRQNRFLTDYVKIQPDAEFEG